MSELTLLEGESRGRPGPKPWSNDWDDYVWRAARDPEISEGWVIWSDVIGHVVRVYSVDAYKNPAPKLKFFCNTAMRDYGQVAQEIEFRNVEGKWEASLSGDSEKIAHEIKTYAERFGSSRNRPLEDVCNDIRANWSYQEVAVPYLGRGFSAPWAVLAFVMIALFRSAILASNTRAVMKSDEERTELWMLLDPVRSKSLHRIENYIEQWGSRIVYGILFVAPLAIGGLGVYSMMSFGTPAIAQGAVVVLALLTLLPVMSSTQNLFRIVRKSDGVSVETEETGPTPHPPEDTA